MDMQYAYVIKFGMLQVRENEISLRKCSDGTAHLLILEGTLATGKAVSTSNVSYRWYTNELWPNNADLKMQTENILKNIFCFDSFCTFLVSCFFSVCFSNVVIFDLMILFV